MPAIMFASDYDYAYNPRRAAYEHAVEQERRRRQARYDDELAYRRYLAQQDAEQQAYLRAVNAARAAAAKPSPVVKIPIVDSTPSTPPLAESICIDENKDEEHLRRTYETHGLRRQKLSTLRALEDGLDARRLEFVLPTALVFQSPSASSSLSDDEQEHDQIPKLAFDPRNGPFLSFEDFLVGLLSRADAVESLGDERVKLARKELVRRVERELTELDQAKERQWRHRVGESSGPATVSEADEIAEPSETVIALDDDSTITPSVDDEGPIPAPSAPTTAGSAPTPTDDAIPRSEPESLQLDHDLDVDSILQAAQKLGDQVDAADLEGETSPAPTEPGSD